jgi:hypothetical protein
MGGNTELPFDNLWHELNADENPSGIGELLEAEHRFGCGISRVDDLAPRYCSDTDNSDPQGTDSLVANE